MCWQIHVVVAYDLSSKLVLLSEMCVDQSHEVCWTHSSSVLHMQRLTYISRTTTRSASVTILHPQIKRSLRPTGPFSGWFHKLSKLANIHELQTSAKDR
jgi:hypothetical protein